MTQDDKVALAVAAPSFVGMLIAFGLLARERKRSGLGSTSVYGEQGKPGFRVEIGEDEIDCFRSRWPASGLGGLNRLYAAFERNGDLSELECNYIGGSCARWDGPALTALVDDMQCAGEAFVGIKDRCQSDDWKSCLVTKRRRR